jgi:hypothetical protein
MKMNYKILIVFIVGLISCHTGIRLTKTYIGGWTEKPIEFVNSIPHVDSKGGYFDLIKSFKWGGIDTYLTNKSPLDWIRKPENLLIAHNTIKTIGYKYFISDSIFKSPMRFQDDFGGMWRHDWEDLSISQVLDSLIDSYNQSRPDSNYFKKFWDRRIAEKNDKVLICVLKDIKSIYAQSFKTDCKEKEVVINDTISRLLKYDLQLQDFNGKPTTEFLWNYFDYLKSIGLNHSAYNLVIEKYPGQIKLDTVVKVLNLDTIPENDFWDTRNNGTWIYTYDDNGP